MTFRKISGQFLDIWAKLTMLQRVSIAAATVAVFSAIAVLVVWANRPAYKTLYADMPAEDIKEVSASLKEKAIDHKVTGNAIEVLPDQVYNTRMMLAQEGLPKTKSTGFELFDESKFGMTEFMQNVNYQRALQGELANTIATMNEVAEAKVHISVPKERLFVQEEEVAKASVVLKLMPNAKLTPDQIKSISHLVSASIKGLIPKNVQIVDTAGNLLSEFLTDENQPLLLTQTQIDHQKEEEKRIEAKLRNVLAPILGNDKFVTKVNVEMDFNKREIMREEFGDTPVLRSQHTLEISSKQTGQGPSGIPGVESNLAEPDILVDNIMSEYSKAEETNNYEISKTVTREEKTGGIIKRLTVAVVVDNKDVIEIQDGNPVSVRQPRSDEDMAKLRGSIAGAVGIDPERGDVLDVTNISFDTADNTLDNLYSQREKNMELISMGAKYASAVVILLLFYLLILRPILKRLDQAKEIDEEMLGESALDAQLSGLDITVGDESGFPKTVDELEREIEAELEESTPVDVEAVKSKVMLKKIEEQANEDPEMIANLMKALIKGS